MKIRKFEMNNFIPTYIVLGIILVTFILTLLGVNF